LVRKYEVKKKDAKAMKGGVQSPSSGKTKDKKKSKKIEGTAPGKKRSQGGS